MLIASSSFAPIDSLSARVEYATPSHQSAEPFSAWLQ